MNAKNGSICSLEDWSVVVERYTPYMAPESIVNVVRGKVFGHPEVKDGSYVITSKIKEAQGRRIVTENNEYILGSVSLGYEEWCQENNIVLDYKNPIKIRK
jgi:hypothetical protein